MGMLSYTREGIVDKVPEEANMTAITFPLFLANVGAQLVLLLGAVWCIAVPDRRVYPMTQRSGWLYVMWALFYFAFASNLAIVILDWNSGLWPSWHRLAIAVPLAALGGALVTWGIATLGTTNTSGVKDGFIRTGPYAITRNPQYLGDILHFVGVSIAANSELALVTHMLTALVFLVTPIIEEPWLVEQYGDEYVRYRRDVPRFL